MWRTVAEVAERYPRLLVWLAEGQVHSKGLQNIFGVPVALLLRVPGVPRILDKVLFLPVAKLAPWRPALYEAIAQQQRYKRNQRWRSAPVADAAPVLHIVADGPPG